MNEINLPALIIIFAVALGTYSLRISGLLFSSKLKESKPLNIFLDSLPATILISLIFPGIINQGLIGIFSALCVVIIMYKTKNVFYAMSIGILIIALYRNFLV